MVVVTTAGRTTEEFKEKAKSVAERYELNYIDRNKRSIYALFERYQDDIYTVGAQKCELHLLSNGDTLTFHPNFSMVRAKRLEQGGKDPLIESSGVQNGMSVLDCTMGLASDSIMLSLAVGQSGHVVSLESDFLVYLRAAEGLKEYDACNEKFNLAMRQIHTVHTDYLTYLKRLSENSFDVVYFDPMFNETFESSNGISGIKQLANHNELTYESVKEALRIAKHKVVLKDHFRSRTFDEFGFERVIRKRSRFHYGIIEV